MTNDVALLGQSVLMEMDAVLGEISFLDEQYRVRRAAATKLEQREMHSFLPGLRDYVVNIEGLKRCVQRVLTARNARTFAAPRSAATAEASVLLEQQEEELQDERDRVTITQVTADPYAVQWAAIKKCHGIISLRRRVLVADEKLGPVVHAVVENGVEWLRLSGVNNRRLISQMAQDGWHPDDSSSSDNDDDTEAHEDDNDSAIDLVKAAFQLVRAARQNRRNGRAPRVHFFLPNVNQGQVDGIDRLLEKVRHMGLSKHREGHVEIIVDCANSAFGQATVPPLKTAIENLFRNTHIDRLTSTLNLDLTVLLSLVSDITHSHPEPKPWWSDQTVSHIKDEQHAPGARLKGLYSALRGRRLVCTEDVFEEFYRIIRDLGTPSTQARAAIILHDTNQGQVSSDRADLVEKFRKLSIHPIPEDIRFPLEVISKEEFRGSRTDITGAIDTGKLPPVAIHVFDKLDRIYHKTCHLYGWIRNITTVSGNLLNVRQIEAVFDKSNTNADDVGPDMFLTSLAISINSAKPCPQDVWDKIKDTKNDRRNAREKEAKQMKNTGVWGPTIGQSFHSAQGRLRKTDDIKTTLSTATCE